MTSTNHSVDLDCPNGIIPEITEVLDISDSTLETVTNIDSDFVAEILRIRNEDYIREKVLKIIEILDQSKETDKDALDYFYHESRLYISQWIHSASKRLKEYKDKNPETDPKVPALFYTIQIIRSHLKVIQQVILEKKGEAFAQKYSPLFHRLDSLTMRKDWIHARDLARILWVHTEPKLKAMSNVNQPVEICDIGAKGGEVAYFLKQHAQKSGIELKIDLFDIAPQENSKIDSPIDINTLDILDTEAVLHLLRQRKGKKYPFLNLSNVFHKLKPGNEQNLALQNIGMLCEEACIISPDTSLLTTLTLAILDDSSPHCLKGSIPAHTRMEQMLRDNNFEILDSKTLGHKASLLDAFGHRMYFVKSNIPVSQELLAA